jgi:hypothetical protein
MGNQCNNKAYLIFFGTLVFIFLHSATYSQGNVADQQFLDNADQFSNQHGVRLRNVNKIYNSNSVDPNLTPLSVRKENDEKKEYQSIKKKKAGLTFSDMAKISKKKITIPDNNDNVTTNENVVTKNTSFTFFNMASMVQKKRPTKNIKIKVK